MLDTIVCQELLSVIGGIGRPAITGQLLWDTISGKILSELLLELSGVA